MALWFVAELLGRAVVVPLHGVVFSVQILAFGYIGPSYQTTLVTFVSGLAAAAFGAPGILALTSFRLRGVHWLLLGVLAIALAGNRVNNATRPSPEDAGAYDAYKNANDGTGVLVSCMTALAGLAWSFWCFAGQLTGRRAFLVAKALVLVGLLVLVGNIFLGWDARHIRGSESTGLLRAISLHACRQLCRLFANHFLDIWPDQHAKEFLVRCFDIMISPYQLIGVAGASNWSEVGIYLAFDWAICLLDVGSCTLADRIDRAVRDRDTGLHKRLVARFGRLLRWLDPQMPIGTASWPDGWEGAVVWRRFLVLTKLASSTGILIGCLGGVGVLFLSSSSFEAAYPTACAFAPQGVSSVAYIGVLVVSESVQDLAILAYLVFEVATPTAKRMLTPEMRHVLQAKVYPPIFSSVTAFLEFAFPQLVSGAITASFVWITTDVHYYRNILQPALHDHVVPSNSTALALARSVTYVSYGVECGANWTSWQ